MNPLDQAQIEAVQNAVRLVAETDDGCGEVVIEIKNHHPRHIKPCPSLKMPYNKALDPENRGYKPGKEG